MALKRGLGSQISIRACCMAIPLADELSGCGESIGLAGRDNDLDFSASERMAINVMLCT